MNRRTFLTSGAAGGLLAACGPKQPLPTPMEPAAAAFSEPQFIELADAALQAAVEAGASYADIRLSKHRTQSVSTREARVTNVRDSHSGGFGVRVLVDGSWGFSASPDVSAEEVVRVARQAVAVAKAMAPLRSEPVTLAPVETHVDVWHTPIRRDPFSVPLSEKVETLLSLNAAAMELEGVSFASSWMSFVREHKLFASTEGSRIEQVLHRCNPSFSLTSVRQGSFTTRNSLAAPQGRGYEYVEDFPWLEDARQAAEQVVAMHDARSVEPGKWDLILVPSHLWLTIHESIGHPTELDRALGYEANYAGTSFLTTDKMGNHKIGSDIVSFEAEKTAPGALATCGYDDDGAKTTEWDLVRDGVFVDYQTTRDQASWIGRERGYATSYAQRWNAVPFQRMPNINLVPGVEKLDLEGLIADTERAILIEGRGSYSIDHQRYNFQFGGQVYKEVQDGKVTGLLRDVAYQANTTEFWNACDAICSEGYEVNGSFYDGKGEPGQSNAVSHGCTPARFRGINVLNTGVKA